MVKKSNYDQEYLDANIEIYYPNCVGVAYVPIYPEQFNKDTPDWFPSDTIPIGFPSPHEFSGTNSHQAIWMYYTVSDIESQLKDLKDLGFNCVRIWTNYFVWNFFKNCETDFPAVSGHFTSSLDHFLSYCDSIQMNVGICLLEHFKVGNSSWSDGSNSKMPALGSGDFDYATPAYIHDAWLQSPGEDREVSGFLASGLGGNYLDGSSYIEDVINICKPYNCITTYDICNAANENLDDSIELFKQCADLIRATDSNMDHKIFLNSEGMTPYEGLALSNPISSHSSIDLVTTHPFFITRRAWNEYMNIAFSGAIKYGKAFYGTECGFPGGFQRYEDMVEYSRARGQKGVGYTFWQAMCGHPKGGEQFGVGGGFLHYDGSVRDFPACEAIYKHAIDLGYRPSDLKLPNELPQSAYEDTDYDNQFWGGVGVRRLSDNYLPYPGHPLYASTSSVAFNHWVADRYGADEIIAEILDWRNREKFSEQENSTLAGDWYTRQYEILNNFYLEFRTPFSDIFQKTAETEWEMGILDFEVDAGQFGFVTADTALSAIRSAIDTSGLTQALTGDISNLLIDGGIDNYVNPASWWPYDDLFDDWFYTYEQILSYLEWTDNSG